MSRMALARQRKIQDFHMGSMQTCSFHNSEFFDPSPFGFYSNMENQKLVQEEVGYSEKTGGLNCLPSFSFDPYGLSSSGFVFEKSDLGVMPWIMSMDYEHEEQRLKWLHSDDRAGECLQSFGESLVCNSLLKRPHMVGGNASVQATKKHCTTVPRNDKPKPIPSNPQSIAAKNRRERISERLRILQDLVPNGTKVDLITMLEKAISYVKFLQLQLKVLATDEFWPVQGGKAPEVAQVKEAMDAILSSHRETRTARENAADS